MYSKQCNVPKLRGVCKAITVPPSVARKRQKTDGWMVIGKFANKTDNFLWNCDFDNEHKSVNYSAELLERLLVKVEAEYCTVRGAMFRN